MASPQLENGFTRIANEVLEATARAHLNGTQWNIISVVWRQTYGYGRKSHALSETFLAAAADCSLRHIKRELTALISANILTTVKEPTFNSPREIAFNKNYSEWRISLQVTEGSPGDGLVTSPGDGLVTQRKKAKDNIKKDTSDGYLNELFNRFWNVYPKKVAKQDALKSWKKIKPSAELVDTIISAVNRVSETEAWQKNNHQYVPNPATWLNRGQWEDEILTVQQTTELQPKRKVLN